MGEVRTSHPRFRRAGDVPRVELTDDDVAILRCVYRHRFVRADDLYRLFGSRSADRLSRRLTLLYRAQFLDRPIAQVDRFRQGGSQPLVYGLDAAGARFLKEKLGSPIGATDWRSRNRTYTRDNLDHTLAVSRYLINLELACRARGDIEMLSFEDILTRAPEKTRHAPAPGRWAVPVQFNGASADVHLVPDAIFGLRIKRENTPPLTSYILLEVDRGTMTIAPAKRVQESDAFLYRATILRKLITYAESHRQGLHQRRFGIGAARVLTLTTSEVRAEAMKAAARAMLAQSIKVPVGLFLFGDEFNLESPFAMLANTAGHPINC